MSQTLADRLAALRREFEQALGGARRPADLDAVKSRFLGRKAGALPALTAELSRMPPAGRREAGRLINETKAFIEGRFDEAARDLAARERQRKIAEEAVDVTLPGRLREAGTLHPITQTRLRIEEIFREMGYTIESGPEVETDFHNFAALNMPPDHPARDSQDTFYLEGDLVLRTHTSPVQIRTMLREKPPIKMIAPGPVYRRDYDLTHLPMFHQVEALVVDRGIRFSDLKGTLEHFCRRLFGASVSVRLSPTYFPFVEPGAEVNISCTVCGGSGCRTCKMTGWLEVLGAGMVHPAVFRAVGYDPEVFTGFAFGMGIDRIAMLERGIDDLRLLLENDLRFLRQFPG